MMEILVLNGSPRSLGNTKKLINAFVEGAKIGRHQVHIMDVCRMNINGCLGCEYCHVKEKEICVQKDDMKVVYERLKKANMVLFASPVYYHDITAQLKCVIDRFYAVGYPGELHNLQKVGMILSSGSPGVYDGILYAYQQNFIEYMRLENIGVLRVSGDVTEESEKEARMMGMLL